MTPRSFQKSSILEPAFFRNPSGVIESTHLGFMVINNLPSDSTKYLKTNDLKLYSKVELDMQGYA